MKVDMNQFLDSFFDEASEHIDSMEAALLQLEDAPDDSELLNTVFRAAHSIKGASSTFGVAGVSEFTHILESLLDRMRDGEIQVTCDSTEVLLLSVDVLEGLLNAAREGSPAPDNTDEIVAQLRKINGQTEDACDQRNREDSSDTKVDGGVYEIRFKPSSSFFHLGLDPLLLLRDLEECGVVNEIQLDASDLPAFGNLDPEACYLSWRVSFHTDQPEAVIRDVFLFVDDESIVEITPAKPTAEAQPKAELDTASCDQPNTAESQASAKQAVVADTEKGAKRNTAAKSSSSPQRESVRVNGDRLDSMINQIGELVIGISMVEQEWASVNGGGESGAIVQLSKIVRDLQEQSLSLRMVPVAATFQKMARIVRDLSSRQSKKIIFEVSGEETELDKTVVDQIGDPLIHMVRNAVDHGIESTEERIAAGKPPEGHVCVRAYHQSGNIYIELKDDGKGLDLERIRSKAIERGIIGQDDKLSKQELCDLVFHAGLSTADKVTDVSGRGVGMDVVRRNIEGLKGSVSLTTEMGVGTTVVVRLPLTLAILDGLLVKLASEVYVVPLLSVVESFRPQASDIKRLANNIDVVQVRGEVVPIMHLHDVFQMDGAITDPSDGLLVIVEHHESKFALLVDDLVGQQQAVIKNLEDNFQKVPGVAGATILGDGRVALILDIVGLEQLAPKSDRQPSLVA